MLKMVNMSLSIAIALLGLAMILYVITSGYTDGVPLGLLIGVAFLVTGLVRFALYRRLG